MASLIADAKFTEMSTLTRVNSTDICLGAGCRYQPEPCNCWASDKMKQFKQEMDSFVDKWVASGKKATTMPWWQDEGVLTDLPLLPPLEHETVVCIPCAVPLPLPLPRESKEPAEEWTVVVGGKKNTKKNTNKNTNKNRDICRYVAAGRKCKYNDCRYAHKLSELDVRTCGYGKGCKKVRWKNGVYFNAPKCGRACNYIHPGEDMDGLWKRLIT